jgi:hypothetical protein
MQRYQPKRTVIKNSAHFGAKAFGSRGCDTKRPLEECYHYTSANWHFRPSDRGADNLKSSPMLP